MKFSGLLVLMFAGLQGMAHDFSKALVKVYSGTCVKAASVSKGSGVLIQVKDKTYVLTSEHVIQSVVPAKCHEVENAELGRIRVTHIASDWGTGLSLLEVARPVETALKPDSFADSLKVTDKVLTAGFPFESDAPAINPGGQILSVESYRHFFPNTDALIEIVNTHGEFGMSGGAVFLEDSGKFLGVLSHQALVLEEGKATKVQTIRKDDGAKNHLLVISAKSAKAWIMKVLDAEILKYIPSFELVAPDRVVTNGLEFRLLKSDDPALKGIGGGGDPVGIGGNGDPVGIGGTKDPVGIGGDGDPVGIGGDPVGIGGVGADDAKYSVVQIRQFKKKDSPATSDALLSKPWWPDLTKLLLQTDRVFVRVMIRKDKTMEEKTSYQFLRIVSLEQFFHRLLEVKNVIPLFIDPSKKELSASEKRIREQAKRVTPLLLKLAAVGGLSDPAQKHLLKIQLVTNVLSSSQWMIVSRAEIQELIEADATQASWNELFTLSFQNTVDLMSTLRKMMEAI